MTLVFEQADLARRREVLLRFNLEYMQWIAENVRARFGLDVVDLLDTPIEVYVSDALHNLCAYAPPVGVFYLAMQDGAPVGMGGLRPLRDGVVEVKRIYVPSHVRGVGARILDRTLEDARAFGCREVLLETGPFMTSAHRLYEAAGFTDIAPYPEAEVPEALRHDWRFMRLDLVGAQPR